MTPKEGDTIIVYHSQQCPRYSSVKKPHTESIIYSKQYAWFYSIFNIKILILRCKRTLYEKLKKSKKTPRI